MRTRALPLVPLSLALLASCGPPVPTHPDGNVCVRTVLGDIDVPKQQAADILIVVDNSGSMAEEQANLAANFLNQNAAECPLQDLKNIPAEFKNPKPELYTGTGPLAQCGFIQLVTAFDNDFRIGVVTTDVGLCDNRISGAQGGAAWGYRPQRGCLHGDGPPASGERKVIARADLDDADASNDDLAARFKTTLENIGTFGSPIERGLDAVDIFLDPNADKNPDCTGDLDAFRRPDASLVVMILSDENDCSHSLAGATFGDENQGEVCGEFPAGITSIPASKCYSAPETLSPVDAYKDALLAIDPRAKVAVIAGAVPVDADGTDNAPSGCIVGPDGKPTGGNAVCFESGGLSNLSGPGEPCGPDSLASHGGLPCCTADAGGRYFTFADEVARKAENSICNSSFRSSLIDIAAFIAAVDVVQLAEPPDDPSAVIVEIKRADGVKETLPPLSQAADCTQSNGYRIENNTDVVLCGSARAGPGDSLTVRARASSLSTECNQPFFEASGGGVNCASSSTMPGVLSSVAVAALMVRRRRGLRAQRNA